MCALTHTHTHAYRYADLHTVLYLEIDFKRVTCSIDLHFMDLKKKTLSSDLILNSTFIKSVFWHRIMSILCICGIWSAAFFSAFNSTPTFTLITAILSNI